MKKRRCCVFAAVADLTFGFLITNSQSAPFTGLFVLAEVNKGLNQQTNLNLRQLLASCLRLLHSDDIQSNSTPSRVIFPKQTALKSLHSRRVAQAQPHQGKQTHFAGVCKHIFSITARREPQPLSLSSTEAELSTIKRRPSVKVSVPMPTEDRSVSQNPFAFF